MARENQGLQIALIVFVMLTLILGVTTYLFYRQYDEANLRAQNSQAEAGKQTQMANKYQEDANELKRLIGAAKTESVDAIVAAFNEDMKKYGGSYPEESRFYRLLLEKMQKTIDEKNMELADAKAQLQRLEEEYKVREASKDPQMKQFEEARDKAAQDLAAEQAKYQNERTRITQDQAKLQADLQNTRKEASDNLAKVESKLKKTEDLVSKLSNIIDEQSTKLEKLTGGKIDSPDGEVLWVNQRSRTLWINLGRADALQPQISFSVYPGDVGELTVDHKKGSIEVTQILGDHLAEARIIEDSEAAPILPGDKIDTVLWNPNQKKRFALAGLFDIDGDGRSDLEAVLNLIRINGGEVDCYIADSGKDKYKQIGQLSVNTNYLILGEAPTEKGDPAQLEAFTKILRDAAQLRIPTVQFGDVLQRMGWKNVSAVVRYGRGANPADFRAKPEGGVPRKSTGNVSDLYQKRQPPKAPPSIY